MDAPTVFQLCVTLIGRQPPVWRRVQVPSDTTLDRLHQILQCLFLWEDCHLHEFHAGGRAYGKPTRGMGFLPRRVLDERRCRLDQLLSSKGGKFHSIYDFGDDWLHEVRLEAALPAEESVLYPRCVAGARSGPPEDIGGVPGYALLLKALADSRHPCTRKCLSSTVPSIPQPFLWTESMPLCGRGSTAGVKMRLAGPAGQDDSGDAPASVRRLSGMAARRPLAAGKAQLPIPTAGPVRSGLRPRLLHEDHSENRPGNRVRYNEMGRLIAAPQTASFGGFAFDSE